MIDQQFVKQNGIYLLSHSVGLPLVEAQRQAIEDFWQPWQGANDNIWPRWLAGIAEFRRGLAELFESESDNFCPQPDISTAVAKIIYSLPEPKAKNVILLSEDDFPSIAYVLEKTAHLGYRLRFIPAEVDLLEVDNWRQYLTADVGVVLLTHVQSNNGRQLPVQQIAALAREAGILSLVDVAQSAGIIPIDLRHWQVDFLVGSSVKWLGGGPGAAYLWVAKEHIFRCQPLLVGWFSHADPFEFDIHHFRYADDAMRFYGGTPSVLPYVIAARSLAFINATTVEKIRQHNLQLCDRIGQQVKATDVVSPQRQDQRGGTLVLDFGPEQQNIIERLRAHNVHFDIRSRGLRLSPHLCNTLEQIDELIEHCL